MKRISVIAISWLLLWCMAVSCDKYDSKIQGKIIYISEQDGEEYAAAGALVCKYSVTSKDTVKVSGVISDTAGNYIMEYVTKGEWLLKAEYVKDSMVYSGCSDIITATGTNEVITRNISLTSVLE
ncbi:MAG: hypothetical protein J5701_05745 [Bacteroidales bacterium]|nr:hypothetical protein [Bacteroidales bacterium]